jgi:hypothetical protein
MKIKMKTTKKHTHTIKNEESNKKVTIINEQLYIYIYSASQYFVVIIIKNIKKSFSDLKSFIIIVINNKNKYQI